MSRNHSVYGPAQLVADARKLARKFPFVNVQTIGKSVLGKPILAIRIGEGPFRWHFNGACHANEWMTSLLLMRFARHYAKACRERAQIGGKPARGLYARNTLWLVPMVNPDGVELVQQGMTPKHPYYKQLLQWNRGTSNFHRWKANVRGVDLNDQFPAHWEAERDRRGIDRPGPRDYGGTGPLTEPEAIALAEWTRRTDPHAAIALHTQGEEIYWNYRDREPAEAGEWAKRLGLASGYRPVWLEGSDAGYKDWFIETFRRPGFTVEAGWGHNPLPIEDAENMYDDVMKLLTEALDLPAREPG